MRVDCKAGAACAQETRLGWEVVINEANYAKLQMMGMMGMWRLRKKKQNETLTMADIHVLANIHDVNTVHCDNGRNTNIHNVKIQFISDSANNDNFRQEIKESLMIAN